MGKEQVVVSDRVKLLFERVVDSLFGLLLAFLFGILIGARSRPLLRPGNCCASKVLPGTALIELFKHEIEAQTRYAFSAFLRVLGALRISSVLVYRREKRFLNEVAR